MRARAPASGSGTPSVGSGAGGSGRGHPAGHTLISIDENVCTCICSCGYANVRDNLAVRRIRPQPTAGDSGVAAEMPSFASDSLDPTVHSAFHNAPMGVAVTGLDGVIVACNPALGELIGTDPAALLGGALYDVIHPDDVDDARQHCATMVADELRVMRHECRFRRMDRRDDLGVDQHFPGARRRRRPRAQGHPRREHQRTQEARGRAQPPGPARSAHGLANRHCSRSGSATSCPTAAATRDRATCSTSTSTDSRR